MAGSRAPASIAHGHSVTLNINGTRALSGPTSFGTKAQAAPIVFDDCSGPDDPRDLWDYVKPEGCNNSNFDMKRRNAGFRNIGHPHTPGARYLAGCHGEGTANTGYMVTVGHKVPTPDRPADVYASHWMRADPNWHFTGCEVDCGGGKDDNFKHFAWRVGAYPATDELMYVYPGGPGTIKSIDDDFVRWQIYPRLPDGNQNGVGHNGNITDCVNVMTKWVKIEVEHRFTEGDNEGFVRIYETPKGGSRRQVLNYQGRFEDMVAAEGRFLFGYYARNYNQPNNWRYSTDLYLDNSLARIVIGDGSTFESSTVHTIQVPAAWSPTSVTFNVRQAEHKQLAGKSVFVVTPDNTPIKVGSFG